MKTEAIDMEIDKLLELKEKAINGTLDERDLKIIYRRFNKLGNIYECGIFDKCYFYTDEGGQIKLVEELARYSSTTEARRTNFSKTMMSVVFKGDGGLGAGIINGVTGKYIPVYESKYKNISTIGGDYVALKDKSGKFNETLLTKTEDLYRIRVAGRYMEGFKKERIELFKDKKAGKLVVIYYNDCPIYVVGECIRSQSELVTIPQNFKIQCSDEFYQVCEDFDDKFMAGDYGPQKVLK